MPFLSNSIRFGISTIHTHREIQCLPYAGFLFWALSRTESKKKPAICSLTFLKLLLSLGVAGGGERIGFWKKETLKQPTG